MKITETKLRRIIRGRLITEIKGREKLRGDDEVASSHDTEFAAGSATVSDQTAVPYTPSGLEKKVNRGVKLNQQQVNAWQWLSPLLPKGARLTSGFRTQADQDRIIRNYASSAKPKIDSSDLDAAHAALKKKGYVIARHIGKGHGSGEAIDVSGARLVDIKRAVEVVTADIEIPVKFAPFGGKFPTSIVENKNRAVHVHILETAPLDEELRSLILDKYKDTGI